VPLTAEDSEDSEEEEVAEAAKETRVGGGAVPKSGGGRAAQRGGDAATFATQAALLTALVVQNATLKLAARRARVVAARDVAATGCGLESTTAVVTIEALKLAGAAALHVGVEGGGFLAQTLANPRDTAKICIPALIYTVNNNLVLVAAGLLQGPLLALFSQLKILTTGLFTRVLLRRQLGPRRWLALVLLTVSVAVVQLARASPAGDAGEQNVPLGLAVVAVACVLAGFAGVYLELVLKESPISLWVRNIHLAVLSLVVAALVVAATPEARDSLRACGFFAGYGTAAWTYVLAQTAGGLLIAAVVKHANNILKALATAVALLLVSLLSAAFYGFLLTPAFFAGATGVVYALFLYANVLKDLPPCAWLPPACGGRPRPT